MKGYVIELDENGDEVFVLSEDRRTWPLPKKYREHEVRLAMQNMDRGHDRRDLAISRNVLHLAVQRRRACWPSWGGKFSRDPRQFSSTPLKPQAPR